jgi:hypothetical protein
VRARSIARPAPWRPVALASLCALAACYQCNAENCALGCCAEGICWVDGADTKCGLSGNDCVDCTQTGEACFSNDHCAVDNGGGASDGGDCLAQGCLQDSDCCSGSICLSGGACGPCVQSKASCGADSDCCDGDCSGTTFACE